MTQSDSQLDRTLKVVSAVEAVNQHVKSKGFGKYKGGFGYMPCPMHDCAGTVRFIVYPHNGHVSAACDRIGCELTFSSTLWK